MELIFTKYDPGNWTEGDEASLDHCAWHGQMQGRHSDKCSAKMIWTVQTPLGKYSACEKAGYDILRHYAARQ
jgi:hypothetical protein